MIGHRASHNDNHYFYWITEPKSGKNTNPVLLIHGFGGTYSGLEELSDLLSDNHTVIGLDLPGYGLSDPLSGRHTLGAYAAFLDHFCETTQYHNLTVVGHSFGADISLVFAAKYPKRVRKLVLLSPVIVSNRRFARMLKHYYALVAKAPYKLRHAALHNHFLTFISARAQFKNASPDQRAKILRDDYISDHLMTDRPIIEGYSSMLSTNFIQKARHINSPTLILSGTEDSLSPKVDMEMLIKAIPEAKLIMLEGEGHFAPMESAKLVNTEITKFIIT